MAYAQPASLLQEQPMTTRRLSLLSDSVATKEIALALAEYEATSQTTQTALLPIDYSIRIPRYCAEKQCASCDTMFFVQGPTGFVGEKEICDLCLFRGDPQLGMILALIAVTRSFARSPKTTFDHFFQALLELGAFARLYEVFAARFGAPRPFILPNHEVPGGAAEEDSFAES